MRPVVNPHISPTHSPSWIRPAILAVAWLLALLYAYPGLMSNDSIEQLVQARGLSAIGDGNPPMLAVIWRYVDKVISGPFGMLLLQTGTFLFGLDAILRRVVSPRAAAIVAGAVLLFPSVLAPMGVIWKDSQMAGYLLTATALLLARRRWPRVAGLALLLVATAVRYNAAAATLPLIVLLFEWTWQGWRRYALAFCVLIAITIGAFGANRALAERETNLWHESLALMDLVGTVKYSHDWTTDEQLREVLAGTPLAVQQDILKWCRWWYWPRWHWTASHGDKRIFNPPTTQAERDAIEAAWWRVVRERPAAYLLHRWRVFEQVIGNGSELMAPVWRHFVESPGQEAQVGVSARHSALQTAWLDAHDWLSTTFLFRPRFYLLLALVLVFLIRTRLALAIIGSGVCYEAGLFFVAPSADFRYSHWMITTTLIGCVLVFVARQRSTGISGRRCGTRRDQGA